MNHGKRPGLARHPLAYKNEKFLDSDDARALRILAEYLEPQHRFEEQEVPGTVVFFGSARLTPDGPLGRYYADARELARLFTAWSNGLPPSQPRFLVCSGGGHGIMEAANRGAAEAGGRTVGLNISLPEEQRANSHITPELSFEFHYFFMRKLCSPTWPAPWSSFRAGSAPWTRCRRSSRCRRPASWRERSASSCMARPTGARS